MQITNLFDVNTGAEISDCRNYRYKLWRVWDSNKPKVLFLMFNPSKADETDNDRTLSKCMRFAKSWGFGGLYIGNLFAYRSTDPEALLNVSDPIGKGNKEAIQEMATQCELIVCAWGNEPILKKLRPLVGTPLENLTNLSYLKLSIHAVPVHPLYLEKDLKPIRFLGPLKIKI